MPIDNCGIECYTEQSIAAVCYSSPITFDAIGNPLSYWNGTLTWEGRQLKTLVKGSISASYKYDAQGLRSYKKVGTEESRYFYLGGKLTYEERGTKKFWYHYDALGALFALTYKNGTAAEVSYLVYTNNRGDVEALYTMEGNLYARYNYDAWGNTISITKLNGDAILPTATEIAYLNPIRYRGYYFDQESGLYYLKSRYYDPQVKRFLNPDSIIFIPGVVNHNIIAYCNNNPVNMIDTDGHYSASLSDNPGTDDRYNYHQAKKEQKKKKKEGGENPRGEGKYVDSEVPPDHPEFVPDKKYPKKVKVPNSKKKGWRDENGNIWIPDNNMHGVPGWVEQLPNGGHNHHYRGGGSRTHKITPLFPEDDLFKMPDSEYFDLPDIHSGPDFNDSIFGIPLPPFVFMPVLP